MLRVRNNRGARATINGTNGDIIARDELALCNQACLFLPGHDRQAVDRLHAGPLAPADLRTHRPPGSDPGQRWNSDFNAHLPSMRASWWPRQKWISGAEGDVPVRLALQIEPLRMRIGLRIHVGGRQHGHDLVALSQADAAELDIPAHIARLGELHRRDEAQKFLDREIGAAPVLPRASRADRDSSEAHAPIR